MPVNVVLPNSSVGPVIAGYGAQVQQGSQVSLTLQLGPGGPVVPVGYATQVAQSDDYGASGFYGLGQISPFEIQPLQFTGQLTVSGGRLYVAPWLGQYFGAAEDILTSGALNVVVHNRVTKATDITYVGLVVQTYTMTYQANAYTIQTMTGLYRTIQLGALPTGGVVRGT